MKILIADNCANTVIQIFILYILVMVSHTLVMFLHIINNEWIYPSHPLLLFVNKDTPNALQAMAYYHVRNVSIIPEINIKCPNHCT